MSFITNKEINTARQFEFDFAKAVCILGMVFVHCYEILPLTNSSYEGALYYTFAFVLNAIFGAGTFMACLGIGLAYTKNNKPLDFIKRGIKIFLLGYVLNIFRFALPSCVYFLIEDSVAETAEYILFCLLKPDIMQFAGLAFIVFGLLKLLKFRDWGIAAVALFLSVAGSFFRFIDIGPVWYNSLLGVLVGTVDENPTYSFYAPFPFINWFIFVVFGYFFGKIIRRCENIEKFYAITTPVSGAVIITYMAIAIPNKYGMLCGNQLYYFQMTTLGALIIMMGAVFVFGLYHYVSKLLGKKIKNLITGLSVNINKTYCIHWVILGCTSVTTWLFFAEEGISDGIVLLISFVIYIISSLTAELVKRRSDRKKVSEHVKKL